MANNANIYQDVLQISETVNCLVDDTGTARHLQDIFKQVLPVSLGNISPDSKWNLAWGPAVWKSNSTGGDKSEKATGAGHIAFVGSGRPIFEGGRDCQVYVIAIGITAGLAELHNEIFGINRVIDIDQWAGSGTSGLGIEPTPIEIEHLASQDASSYIANGLGQALFHLIKHKLPFRNSQTLLQFVQDKRAKEPGAKIVFTGHSIGGALASSLAYTFAKAGVLGSTPSSNTYVYPTGAPSPGNLAFAQAFSEYFPPSREGKLKGYQLWNVNIVNPLDIVPYAYCTDLTQTFTLDKIATLYENPSFPGTKIENVEDFIGKLKKNARGMYYPLKSSTFESPVPKPPISPNSTIVFLFSAGQQHISAYKVYILANGGQGEEGPSNK